MCEKLTISGHISYLAHDVEIPCATVNCSSRSAAIVDNCVAAMPLSVPLFGDSQPGPRYYHTMPNPERQDRSFPASRGHGGAVLTRRGHGVFRNSRFSTRDGHSTAAKKQLTSLARGSGVCLSPLRPSAFFTAPAQGFQPHRETLERPSSCIVHPRGGKHMPPIPDGLFGTEPTMFDAKTAHLAWGNLDVAPPVGGAPRVMPGAPHGRALAKRKRCDRQEQCQP